MSLEKKNPEYLKWIDVARGIAIICVVTAHTLSPFGIIGVKYLSGWEVMFFFFITGYLLKDKHDKFGPLLLKMIKGYVRPYFILCGINLFIVVLKDILVKQFSFLKVFSYCFGIIYCHPAYMPNCTPLWFLTCVFVVRIVLFFLITKRFIVQIIGVMGCLACGILICMINIHRLPWCIGPALFGVFFCYLGFVIKKFDLFRFFENKIYLKLLFVVFSMSIGFLAIHFNHVRVILQEMNNGNVFLMLTGAVFCSCGMLFVCKQLGGFNCLINSIFSWFGKHTLFIMGFDFLSREIAMKVLSRLHIYNFFSSFIFRIIFLVTGCIIWNKIVKLFKNKNVQKALAF